MLADVVCGLWLLMTAILGWKRKAKMEFPTLIILALSYGGARFGSLFLSGPVDSFAKKGPLAGAAMATVLLWPVLYYALQFVWKKLPKGGNEAGIRITVDANGNPVVNRGSLLTKSFLGAVFGVGRGVILYTGTLYILLLIVPSTMYKDGRGTVIVHPKSVTLKLVRQVDPTLKNMDSVTKGLQTLHLIRTSSKVRRKAYRSQDVRKLLRQPTIKKLRRKRKLLHRANYKRQGRRDSTLILWLRSYQETVTDPKSVQALKKLNKLMSK